MELQDLRAENERLNEELRRFRGEVPYQGPHYPLPYSATDLRVAAARPDPDPPHVATSEQTAISFGELIRFSWLQLQLLERARWG